MRISAADFRQLKYNTGKSIANQGPVGQLVKLRFKLSKRNLLIENWSGSLAYLITVKASASNSHKIFLCQVHFLFPFLLY